MNVRNITVCCVQVLYAAEGESKMPEIEPTPSKSCASIVEHKGHDFVSMHFRTPTTCESCEKSLWHVVSPPAALECRCKYCAVVFNSFLFYLKLQTAMSYSGSIITAMC